MEGLFTSYSVGYQQRTPRENTSNFSYRFKDRDYPENTPRNSAVDFEQHNLLFQRLLVRYAFGYKLYKEPNRVFYNFDSTYPTLRLFLTNGSGSVERYNFTKLDLRLSHKLNFGALGSTRYALQEEGFYKKKNPVLMICNTLTAMQHPLEMLPTGHLTCCPTTNGVQQSIMLPSI